MILHRKLRNVALLLAAFLSVVILHSCTKEPIAGNDIPENLSAGNEKRFFDESAVKSETVLRILSDLKQKSRTANFQADIIKRVGYPRWDHGFRSIAVAPGTTVSDSTYIIPMVDTDNRQVTGIMVASLNNTISYRLVLAKDYNLHSTRQAKEYHVSYMVRLNNKVFGHSRFLVNDSTIFPGVKKIFLKKSRNISSAGNNATSSAVCSQIVEIWHDPDGDADPCDCSGNEYKIGEYTEIWICNTDDEWLPPLGGWNCPDAWGNCPGGWGDGGGTGTIIIFDDQPLPLEGMITQISLHLNTTLEEEAWLRSNEIRTKEIYELLAPAYDQQVKEALKLHLVYLTGNWSYYMFIDNYRYQFPNQVSMWWENESWIHDNIAMIRYVDAFKDPKSPLIFDNSDAFSAPAADLQKMINCFTTVPDAGATYRITLNADLPDNSDPDALTNNLEPGHAFITMTKTNGTQSVSQSIGFYPKRRYLSVFSTGVDSKIVDNGLHEYNSSISMNLSQIDFMGSLNLAVSHSGLNYDLNDFNCTDFALQIFNSNRNPSQHIQVPDWVVVVSSPYSGLVKNFGTTPNGLHKALNLMKTNNTWGEAANISIVTANAVAGAGECP